MALTQLPLLGERLDFTTDLMIFSMFICTVSFPSFDITPNGQDHLTLLTK